jgi:Rieske Fe-S protein
MSIDRRRFLALSAAAAVLTASEYLGIAGEVGGGQAKVINAGPVTRFAADGVYDEFRDLGFFVIRKGVKLFALSSICTHRQVTLKAEPDCSFYCKRHGSTFSPTGHVTEGPAKRDLPVLVTAVDGHGQLLVRVPQA